MKQSETLRISAIGKHGKGRKMDYLVYITYPALLVFLLWNAHLAGRKQWNEGAMSLSQTKAVQGFFAVLIMLHHISHRTCASWVPAPYIRHGLDVFVQIGTFFVGYFLFCSGYGLMKSCREKEDYLKGFYGRRMRRILLAFLSTNLVYFLVRLLHKDRMIGSVSYTLKSFWNASTYSWYAVAIFIFYFVFRLANKLCKKEWGVIAVSFAATVVYMLFCERLLLGEWWYNTMLLMVLGMIFAGHEEGILRFLKKIYFVITPIAVIGSVFFQLFSEHVKGIYYGTGASSHYYRWCFVLLQLISVIFFVLAVLCFSLKVSVGNKALSFMGTITLEFYLIHGIFVQIFAFSFFDDIRRPMFYIKSVPLYILVVFALSLPSAWLLAQLDSRLTRLLGSFWRRLLVFGKKNQAE